MMVVMVKLVESMTVFLTMTIIQAVTTNGGRRRLWLMGGSDFPQRSLFSLSPLPLLLSEIVVIVVSSADTRMRCSQWTSTPSQTGGLPCPPCWSSSSLPSALFSSSRSLLPVPLPSQKTLTIYHYLDPHAPHAVRHIVISIVLVITIIIAIDITEHQCYVSPLLPIHHSRSGSPNVAAMHSNGY